MIKKILFILATLFAGTLFSQTFQLMDHTNVNIGGTSHYEYGDLLTISATKFHVKNISGTLASYATRVQVITNPTSSDLQVCFSVNCQTAGGTNPSVQNIAGSASVTANKIDTTFKVAPFTWAWNPGDSATWMVTVYNISDPNDSASAIITWKSDPVSVDEITSDDVTLSAYPNPASNSLTISYSIKGKSENAKLNVYDVLGQMVRTYSLATDKNKLSVDLNDLNSGIYFYTIRVDEKTLKTERVIVK